MVREFIYFKIFDKIWEEMGLSDDDQKELENIIMENPAIGKVMQGTGGVRKMRFVLPNNKGKSGGARILYVDYAFFETTIFLNIYTKGEKGNITDNEKKQLRKVVEGIARELKK